MGKDKYAGLKPRKDSILIDFRYQGQRYQPAVKLDPAIPKNMDYCANLRNKVLAAIKAGTFTFAEFFPESRHVAKTETKKWPTFYGIAQQWLETKKRELSVTTYPEYRRSINNYFSREYKNPLDGSIAEPFNNRVMAEITLADIDAFLAGLEIGNRTYNDVLWILKNIFEYAVDRSETTGVTVNPAQKKKSLKKPKANPDPLLPEEINLVLADMEKYYPEPIVIYFSLAFRLGFRPSEGIALKWGDIDWNNKTIAIRRARVRSQLKALKTEGNLKADEGNGRIVEIDDESISLLKRLRKHTEMKGEWLFRSRKTGEPYLSPQYLVQLCWRPSLKRCKIRDRDARQTRHTCATMMLMAYAEPRWCSQQLGHSEEMFRKVYSKWMPHLDNRQQLAKFSAMFKKPELKVVENA